MPPQESPDISLQRTALQNAYATGDIQHCIIHHLNLANHLEAAGGEGEAILAHRLAAGLLVFQSGSELLGPALGQLAASLAAVAPGRPAVTDSFDRLCQALEISDGVPLRALAAQQAREGAADGDEALHAAAGMAMRMAGM